MMKSITSSHYSQSLKYQSDILSTNIKNCITDNKPNPKSNFNGNNSSISDEEDDLYCPTWLKNRNNYKKQLERERMFGGYRNGFSQRQRENPKNVPAPLELVSTTFKDYFPSDITCTVNQINKNQNFKKGNNSKNSTDKNQFLAANVNPYAFPGWEMMSQNTDKKNNSIHGAEEEIIQSKRTIDQENARNKEPDYKNYTYNQFYKDKDTIGLDLKNESFAKVFDIHDDVIPSPKRLKSPITMCNSYLINKPNLNDLDNKYQNGKLIQSFRSKINQMAQNNISDTNSNYNLMSIYETNIIELIASEIAYKRDLSMIIDIYLNFSNTSSIYKNILNSNEKKIIFSNIQKIHDLTDRFLSNFLDFFKNAVNYDSQSDSSSNCSSLLDSNDVANAPPLLSLLSPQNIPDKVIASPVKPNFKLSKQAIELLEPNNVTSFQIKYLIQDPKLKDNCKELNIGGYLVEFFNDEFLDSYIYYLNNHKKQIEELKKKIKFSEPIVQKWLNECKFFTKSKTNIWDFESLLNKPIQRIVKYKLLVNNLISSYCVELGSKNDVDNDKILEDLNTAREEIYEIHEKIVTRKNQITTTFDATYNGTMDDQRTLNRSKSTSNASCNQSQVLNDFSDLFSEILPAVSSVSFLFATSKKNNRITSSIITKKINDTVKLAPKSRQEYIRLVLIFKFKYELLKRYKHDMLEVIQTIENFSNSQFSFAESWRILIEMFNPELPRDFDAHFIKSSYTNYLEKLGSQKQKTRVVILLIEERIIQKLTSALQYCDEVRAKINDHRSKRKEYVKYIKENEKKGPFNNKLFGQINEDVIASGLDFKKSKKYEVSDKAQSYIYTENMVKDELPQIILLLDELVKSCYLSFMKIFADEWLKAVLMDNRKIDQKKLYPDRAIIDAYNMTVKSTKEALLRALTNKEDVLSRFNNSKTFFQCSPTRNNTFKFLYGV
ncbi:Fus2p [Ascoidea rubescens DSM 1968]|uniref:Dbl homology domain-containing protein n=1 Tax=Ascoidea rubescens DSM 1968 TaxID=1344418 RepID=A0A1D2VCI0_9ASCO|nr:Dbl homology domain-containing protein [Ascoidea rubescens DSM 1968]ODV59346.1 Dbl homology domain-containing protein [Ascoidea rubescens DSM 1968]